MIVGYCRVSTEQQVMDRQVEIMKKYNVERTFEEKMTGKDTNRPVLNELMQFVRDGDTIVIESYSRLARNNIKLHELLEKLTQKGVTVISAKESFDTSTATGKLMLTLCGAFAEFERDVMLERQREAIRIAKEQGKYTGRPKKKIPNEIEIINDWVNRKISAKAAAEIMGISRATFYRRWKQGLPQSAEIVH